MKKTAISLGIIFALLVLAGLTVPFIDRTGCGSPRIISELNMLSVAISAYKSEFTGLPPVENLDRALLGDNSRKLRFYTPRHNEPAPIKDPWGTAFQFTYTPSGTVLIRSAGKDKIFSTEDDYTKETEELTR
jgi:hypothetical protein